MTEASGNPTASLRDLPSVDRVLAEPALADTLER
ncbi:MAG: hypothetical protein J4N29_05015, partial [Chloroflexi bacterium]|nr:hypothetical protein [Chloroflexota bacterium]